MVLFQKMRCRFSLHISKPNLLFFTVWLMGLILGTTLAAAASNRYFLLMRTAMNTRVSIVGLAVTVLLPLLLAAFAIYKDNIWALYPICMIKAFAFAFAGFGTVAVSGTASWLIRPLFQFADIYSVPILCWFTLSHLSGKRIGWKKNFLACLCLDFLICCLDLCYVSPFMALLTQK